MKKLSLLWIHLIIQCIPFSGETVATESHFEFAITFFYLMDLCDMAQNIYSVYACIAYWADAGLVLFCVHEEMPI